MAKKKQTTRTRTVLIDSFDVKDPPSLAVWHEGEADVAYGGKSFSQDYWFQEKKDALYWFRSINGNEDIFALHRETDLDPITDMPGTTNV